MMEFFADGGFQQLFCDLNEEIEQDFNSWQTTSFAHQTLIAERDERDEQEFNEMEQQALDTYDNNNNNPVLMDLNEKELQVSLDYLLKSSTDAFGDYEGSTFSSLTKELSDWEEKFLDNYIEIPELVDFLPDKTPFCTDNCNHFLQESAENLKLLPISFDASSDAVDKSYPCTYGDCRKVYAKPAHLKAHLRRHLGEKPYVCNWPDCIWRFSRSDELARHRRSHSGVKPYKCSFCAKCFARSDHLTKHRKVHERRLLAATKAGKTLLNGELPLSVLTVRPGRKKKHQL